MASCIWSFSSVYPEKIRVTALPEAVQLILPNEQSVDGGRWENDSKTPSGVELHNNYYTVVNQSEITRNDVN